jgi:hypothetical protein
MSWKTSLFGLLAAIGAAVLAGLSTGIIDPATLPPWVKSAAALLSVIGTAGTGFFARDNDKTSEDVGAKPAATPVPINRIPIFLLAGVLCLGFTGCSSTPARIAYNTAAAPAITVDHAMQGWGDYVAQFHPGAASEAKVKAAFERYQAAELAAIDAGKVFADVAASGSTNTLGARVQSEVTSQAASDALASLVNLIQQLGVKL